MSGLTVKFATSFCYLFAGRKHGDAEKKPNLRESTKRYSSVVTLDLVGYLVGNEDEHGARTKHLMVKY
jgi:hypothetical protein